MILNPQEVYAEGYIKYLGSSEQIQQNGIDLRLNKVFSLATPLVLKKKEREISEIVEIFPINGKFKLKALTPYLIETKEHITIPKDAAAMIIQRSSLNRSGIQILSSWYDSGFVNYGGATVYPFMDAEIEQGARIVQIIYFEAKSASEYKGTYTEK